MPEKGGNIATKCIKEGTPLGLADIGFVVLWKRTLVRDHLPKAIERAPVQALSVRTDLLILKTRLDHIERENACCADDACDDQRFWRECECDLKRGEKNEDGRTCYGTNDKLCWEWHTTGVLLGIGGRLFGHTHQFFFSSDQPASPKIWKGWWAYFYRQVFQNISRM